MLIPRRNWRRSCSSIKFRVPRRNKTQPKREPLATCAYSTLSTQHSHFQWLVDIKFIFIRFPFLRRSFGNKHLNFIINIVRVIKRTFRGTWRWWWRCWWLYSPFWSAWVPCFHHVKQGIEPLAKSMVFLVPLYPCCCLLGEGSLFILADTLEFGSHFVDCHCELVTSSWCPLFQLIQDFGIDGTELGLIENCFGILAARWGSFLEQFKQKLKQCRKLYKQLLLCTIISGRQILLVTAQLAL